MKHRETIGFLVVMVGVVALAVVMYTRSVAPVSAKSLKPVLAPGVEAVLEGLSRITSSQSGNIEWSLSCQGLTFYKERKWVEVVSPFAEIPIKDGGTTLVEGDQGGFSQASEDIMLSGKVKITVNRNGRVEWVIDGDTASYRKAQDSFYIASVNGLLYPSPEERVELSGDRGRYHVPSRVMELDDRVNIEIYQNDVKQWRLNGSRTAYQEEPGVYYLIDMSGVMYAGTAEGTRIKADTAWYDTQPRIMNLEKNVEIRLQRGKEKEWVLNGETASYHQDQEVFYISQLVGVQQGSTGEPLEVRADRADYRAKEQKMHLENNVVCGLGQGIRLFTEVLDFDESSGRAKTEAKVRLEGQGWKLEGVGLEADTGANQVVVKKSVKIRLDQGFGG